MKKKILIGIAAVALFVVTLTFSKESKAVVSPSGYYQTMSYCGGWHMKLACTTTHYATFCSRYWCLV